MDEVVSTGVVLSSTLPDDLWRNATSVERANALYDLAVREGEVVDEKETLFGVSLDALKLCVECGDDTVKLLDTYAEARVFAYMFKRDATYDRVKASLVFDKSGVKAENPNKFGQRNALEELAWGAAKRAKNYIGVKAGIIEKQK